MALTPALLVLFVSNSPTRLQLVVFLHHTCNNISPQVSPFKNLEKALFVLTEALNIPPPTLNISLCVKFKSPRQLWQSRRANKQTLINLSSSFFFCQPQSSPSAGAFCTFIMHVWHTCFYIFHKRCLRNLRKTIVGKKYRLAGRWGWQRYWVFEWLKSYVGLCSEEVYCALIYGWIIKDDFKGFWMNTSATMTGWIMSYECYWWKYTVSNMFTRAAEINFKSWNVKVGVQRAVELST